MSRVLHWRGWVTWELPTTIYLWGKTSPRAAFIALAITSVAAFALDRITKIVVIERVVPVEGESVPLAGPLASITHVHNSGVAFGLFTNRNALFGIVALAVVVVIVNFYRSLPPDLIWLRISLGLLLGGASGNLLDRVAQGYVTDFIDLRLGTGHNVWPVFNVADSCVCVGVAMLAIYLIFQPASSSSRGEGVGYGHARVGDHPRVSD